MRVVRCPDCGHLSDVQACFCVNCEQDLRLVRGEVIDLGRDELRALSPAEYVEAARRWGSSEYWGSSLDRCRTIILLAGWIPIGIVAIVAGIVVAFISGDWWQLLLIALGGTVLGYLATIGATTAFDYLDIRWLRTCRPEEAGWAILLAVGPAVALLVAVLVLNYGLALGFATVLDLALEHRHILLVTAIVVQLVLWLYFSDDRQQPLGD